MTFEEAWVAIILGVVGGFAVVALVDAIFPIGSKASGTAPPDPARERKALLCELSYIDAEQWEYQRMAALGKINRHRTYQMLAGERRRPEIIARLRQLDSKFPAAPATDGRSSVFPNAAQHPESGRLRQPAERA